MGYALIDSQVSQNFADLEKLDGSWIKSDTPFFQRDRKGTKKVSTEVWELGVDSPKNASTYVSSGSRIRRAHLFCNTKESKAWFDGNAGLPSKLIERRRRRLIEGDDGRDAEDSGNDSDVKIVVAGPCYNKYKKWLREIKSAFRTRSHSDEDLELINSASVDDLISEILSILTTYWKRRRSWQLAFYNHDQGLNQNIPELDAFDRSVDYYLARNSRSRIVVELGSMNILTTKLLTCKPQDEAMEEYLFKLLSGFAGATTTTSLSLLSRKRLKSAVLNPPHPTEPNIIVATGETVKEKLKQLSASIGSGDKVFRRAVALALIDQLDREAKMAHDRNEFTS